MRDPADFPDVQAVFKAALRDANTELTDCDDPVWLEADEPTRKQLVRMVAENKMIALGYVPSSWIYRGKCKHCGEVPLDAPVEQELVGCPWCASPTGPQIFCFV